MTNNERFNITPTADNLTVRHGVQQDFVFKNHSFLTTSTISFLNLIMRKGTAEKTIITYTEKGMTAILDDTVTQREQDLVVHRFEYNETFDEWRRVFGSKLPQKDLMKFLQARPDEEKPCTETLLMAASHLVVATEISGEYRHDDAQNITVAFKSRDKEGTARLPKQIILWAKVLNESDFEQVVEIDVEIILPKSADEKPYFTLSCPKLQRYWRNAVLHEIEVIKEALPNHLILAGTVEANHKYV